MKILYTASEVRSFAATGGLGDVAEGLPRALNKKEGVECRVVMPMYSSIPDKLRVEMKEIVYFDVLLAGRTLSCGVFETEYQGVIYYFIDNEQYFTRDKLYGYSDDCERFTFFSLSIMEMLTHIGFMPDIINANDWQTALVPIYWQVFYAHNKIYSGIKTVFTIHNINFQETHNLNKLYDIFGLPPEVSNIIEYDGKINLLKGAIETSHAFTTVSPTYAEEIAGMYSDMAGYDFGKGLTPFIKERYSKLTGILNGLDSSFDPAVDKDLYANYGIFDFAEGKAKNKLELQKRLELEQKADVPLIAMVTRIDSQQKGCQHVIEIIKDLLDKNDIQFVILGSAAETDSEGKEMEKEFEKLAKENEGKMAAYIGYEPELAQKIYAGADIFLMPSRNEPCGLAQMNSLVYGTIPVVHKTGGLTDTVTDNKDGNGNGFTYKNYDSRELKNATERALLAYKDSKGWEMLIKRAMKCDFSWENNSAEEYIKCYKTLLG